MQRMITCIKKPKLISVKFMVFLLIVGMGFFQPSGNFARTESNLQENDPQNQPGEACKPDQTIDPLLDSFAIKEFQKLPLDIQKKMGIDGYSIYLASHDKHLEGFLTSYPTMEDHGVTYVAMFLETAGGDPGLARHGAIGVDRVSPKYYAAEIPAIRIAEFASMPGVVRMEPSRWMVPLLDKSTMETNIRNVQTACDLKGQGVVVGVVDSGIELNHPDFYDHIASRSRIEWLWDERQGPSTPLAAPYLFNFPNAIATPQDNIGHGTHVAGIAAGNGFDSGGLYTGVAPEAALMVAKCAYVTTYVAQPYSCILAQTSVIDDWTVLNGIRFIFAKADAVNKPAVVNLSLGGFYGPHDGTSIMESMLDTIVIPSHLVVASAGNELDKGYHAGVTLAPNVDAYWDWRWVAQPTCRSSSAALGIYEDIDGWYDPKDDIYIAITGRNLSGPVTFRPYPSGYIGTGLITAPNSVMDQRRQASRCNMFTVFWNRDAGNFRIRFYGVGGVICGNPPFGNPPPIPGIDYGPYNIRVGRRSTAGNGVVDMWNGTTHLVFPTKGSFKVAGLWDDSDPNKSLVTPFATAKKVITVGAYVTRENTDGCFLGYSDTLGSLASFSSCGPTRDGRMKPEVTAPGAIIISAKSSSVTPVPSPCMIAPPSTYFKDFGTSMAAPHVTGLLALWLQQTPVIGYEEAVNILRTTSRPVVDSTPLPNNRWGFGKIGIECPSGPYGTPTPTFTPTAVTSPAFTCCIASVVPTLNFNPNPKLKPRGLAWKQSSKQLFVTAFSIPNGLPFVTIPHLVIFNFTSTNMYNPNYRRVKTHPSWQNPYGLALSSQEDYLFLTDNTANFVQKIDITPITGATTADVVATFGNTGADLLNGPRGVCVDPATNLVYVADSNNHRIQVFQETPVNSNVYTIVATLGGPAPGSGPNQFNSPTGLLIWNNALYVADTGNRRIMKYPIVGPDPVFGAPTTMVDASTHGGLPIIPMMMALGPDGYVYVTDQADQFETFDPMTEPWTYIQKCGSHGSAVGQLSLPFGIAVDTSNHVYVADSLNDRVQMFVPCLGTPTLTFTPTPTNQVVIQAEDACAYDGTKETDASGTIYVDLADSNEAGLTFALNNTLSIRQNVMLTIRYANGSGSPRPMWLRRISTTTTYLNYAPFRSTGSWDNWSDQTVMITLEPGNNVVQLVPPTWNDQGGPNLDRISFVSSVITAGDCPATPTPTPTPVVIQAEDACAYDGTKETDASGTIYVDLADSNEAGLTFALNNTLSVPRNVTLTIRYANGSSASRMMRLRRLSPSTVYIAYVSFVPTGSWDNWSDRTVTITLVPGNNVIQLIPTTGNNRGGPNLDKISFISSVITVGDCPATPTPEDTRTLTATFTDTRTATHTMTDTPTATMTDTWTSTDTQTITPTDTAIETPTECCQIVWSQGGLNQPRGVAAHGNSVWVVHANGGNTEISKYNLYGVPQGSYPMSGITSDVSDMVLGPDDYWYIGDRPANTVWIVNVGGGIVSSIPGIDGLSGLYVDPAGVVYVTTEGGTLLRYEKECDGPGYVLRGRGSLGLGGLGVVTRANGVLYVAVPQQGVYAIQEALQPDGTWLYSAGAQSIGIGPTDDQVMDPFDLASDADGNLYVEVMDGIKKFEWSGSTAVYVDKCEGNQVRMDIGFSDGNLYTVDDGNLIMKSPCFPVGPKPGPMEPICYQATPTPIPFVCPPTSVPGQDWIQSTANTGYNPRFRQSSVVFDDGTGPKMYIIGGSSSLPPNIMGDVLSSSNGVSWNQVAAHTAFPPRFDHTSVVYDAGSGPKIWVIGGNSGSGDLSDVWYSSNGASWTPVSNGAFSARSGHSSVFFQNKMWILGGSVGGEVLNSIDGVTWNTITTSAPFGAYNHETVVFDAGCGPELWVTYGQYVWHSPDGAIWTAALAPPLTPYPSLSNHAFVVYDNKMWLLHGQGVWYSTDGINWIASTTTPAFGLRSFHTAVVFDNRIWVINGLAGSPSDPSADIWYSCGSIPMPTPTCFLTSTPTYTPTPYNTPVASTTAVVPPTNTPTSYSTAIATTTVILPLAVSGMELSQVLPYPNPSDGKGVFLYFDIASPAITGASTSDNRALYDPDATVVLSIYSFSHRLIWRRAIQGAKTGGDSVFWDGKDAHGASLSNGAYIYRAQVTSRGKVSTRHQYLMILR